MLLAGACCDECAPLPQNLLGEIEVLDVETCLESGLKSEECGNEGRGTPYPQQQQSRNECLLHSLSAHESAALLDLLDLQQGDESGVIRNNVVGAPLVTSHQPPVMQGSAATPTIHDAAAATARCDRVHSCTSGSCAVDDPLLLALALNDLQDRPLDALQYKQVHSATRQHETDGSKASDAEQAVAAAWRGYYSRWGDKAAAVIQRAWRVRVQRRCRAAVVLQACWRGCMARRAAAACSTPVPESTISHAHAEFTETIAFIVAAQHAAETAYVADTVGESIQHAAAAVEQQCAREQEATRCAAVVLQHATHCTDAQEVEHHPQSSQISCSTVDSVFVRALALPRTTLPLEKSAVPITMLADCDSLLMHRSGPVCIPEPHAEPDSELARQILLRAHQLGEREAVSAALEHRRICEAACSGPDGLRKVLRTIKAQRGSAV